MKHLLRFARQKTQKYVLITIISFMLFIPILASHDGLNQSNSQKIRPLNATTGTSAGQAVVDYYRQVFEYDWSIGREYDPDTEGLGLAAAWETSGSPNFDIMPEKYISGEMKITPILSPDNSRELIIGLINKANTSLFIQQMYIYAENADIVNAIIAAHDRGVNCSILLGEGSEATNEETAALLNDEGIEVRICDGTGPLYFATVHNKGVLVDGKITLVASINWSPTSIDDNREAGLIIENEAVCGYYTNFFYNDWDGSADNVFVPEASGVSSLSSLTSNNVVPQTAYLEDYDPPFSNETISGEMTIRALASPDNIYNALVDEISKAKSSIDVSVYTFSNPWLMQAVLDKIAEGVEVRLLLGRPLGGYEINYNKWTLFNLTRLGVADVDNPSVNNTAQGLWSSATFNYQHCKYAIIDNETLVLSSGNWSLNSCPVPDEDEEVYGNRDWWMVVYGTDPGTLPDNNDGNNDDPTDDPPEWAIWALLIVILTGAAGLGIKKFLD